MRQNPTLRLEGNPLQEPPEYIAAKGAAARSRKQAFLAALPSRYLVMAFIAVAVASATAGLAASSVISSAANVQSPHGLESPPDPLASASTGAP